MYQPINIGNKGIDTSANNAKNKWRFEALSLKFSLLAILLLLNTKEREL